MKTTTSLLLSLMMIFGFASGLRAQEAPVAAPEKQAPPVVNLLDAGEQPRHVLRYHFRAGASESMTMRMKMSIAQEFDGEKMDQTEMPVMVMTMQINMIEVLESGEGRYTFEFTDVDVEATDPEQEMMVEPMRAAMQTIVGLKGSAIVSPRGYSRDSKIEMPENLLAPVRQQIEGMRESIDQMVAPLPEEAVGLNAKWSVGTDLEMNGLKLKQTATYTCITSSEEYFAADITVSQEAPAQMIHGVQLDSMKTQGNGKLRVNLYHLVPESQMTAKTEAAFSMGEDTMKQISTIELTIGETAKPGDIDMGEVR